MHFHNAYFSYKNMTVEDGGIGPPWSGSGATRRPPPGPLQGGGLRVYDMSSEYSRRKEGSGE